MTSQPHIKIPIMLASVLFFSLLFGLFLQRACAKQAKPLFFSGGSKEPIEITSDTLVYDQKKNLAVYSGSVLARQKNTTIECDKLQIILSKKDRKLEQVIATGKKVIIKIQQKKGICRKAHYFATGRRLILSGNPSLDDGKNVITGEQIIFYLDEDRSVIKGNRKKRVKTTIFPGDKNFGMGWK